MNITKIHKVYNANISIHASQSYCHTVYVLPSFTFRQVFVSNGKGLAVVSAIPRFPFFGKKNCSPHGSQLLQAPVLASQSAGATGAPSSWGQLMTGQLGDSKKGALTILWSIWIIVAKLFKRLQPQRAWLERRFFFSCTVVPMTDQNWKSKNEQNKDQQLTNWQRILGQNVNLFSHCH